MKALPKMIVREVRRLKTASHVELKRAFRELYGHNPKFPMQNLIRAEIICKIQEEYYGDLTATQKEALTGLLDTSRVKGGGFVPGMRFIREWRGKVYEVCALADNKFECEGKIFHSLSGVATHIVGTTRNGFRFFGVKHERN